MHSIPSSPLLYSLTRSVRNSDVNSPTLLSFLPGQSGIIGSSFLSFGIFGFGTFHSGNLLGSFSTGAACSVIIN